MTWDNNSSITAAYYDTQKEIADDLGAKFQSPDVRVVDHYVYSGTKLLGDLDEWRRMVSQSVDGYSPQAFKDRGNRYEAALILAHFDETVAAAEIDRAVAAIDRTTDDFGMNEV